MDANNNSNGTKLSELFRAGLKSGSFRLQEATEDTLLVHLDKELVRKAADLLVQEAGARFMITTATDKRQSNGQFEICHVFSLDAEHTFVLLNCLVSEADARIESITPSIPGASWSEREAYDVVGVKSDGHPDPRRLLLADDWPEGVFPLRKDFPYNYKPPPQEGVRQPLADPPPGTSAVVIGPFFPVLEEPSYWRLFVKGETVVGCDYRGFYNHRGIEKLGDSVMTYNEIPYLAERICGICGFIHSSCYCQAAEKAAGIEVPRRARYLRTLLLELERIHSHLLWLGIAGHILGFDTVLMQSWRVREPVMWLCEEISGNRKTYGMNTIGGVRRDFPDKLRPKLEEILKQVEKELTAIHAAIIGDSTLHARTKRVGVLTTDWAKKVCVVGPPARASGVPIDARVDHPYAAYDENPVNIAVQSDGDTWARVVVRVLETFESIRLVRQTLANMPEGPLCAEVKEEIPPDRIGVSVVEAPRGEAIHIVMTGGDNRPYRWRVRAPTYPNLQAAPAMFMDNTIADVPITLGSLDPCFSCTERMEVVDVKSHQITTYTHQDLTNISRELTRGIGKKL
jgi:Ni,Fe-hydrogenase III large subunit/Ni,Fe-hydrogenase III component G